MASTPSPPMSPPVNPGRIRTLKEGSGKTGPVVYWMFRDQRLKDNWALIHAVHQANKSNVPVAGEAEETVSKFVRECGASLLVTDMSPLREVKKCKAEICERVSDLVTVHEVDAHNIVPLWVASEKLEYSARTLRGKINKKLSDYLVDFPNVESPTTKWISAQRCALEARKLRNSYPQAVDTFLEELIVRRELADNFCYYQPHYDSLQGAWEWARKTLLDHASDKRQHNYTREQLEKAQTADPLWNASQLEMVHYGKMHGFMRMYWAKKILEWTRGPEEALEICIYLNDKYEMDGRDPSGYVGCMWSICGVHDQGWRERPIFGKIRYMNYEGCKRKFDVDRYIAYVNKLVGELRKRKAENLPSQKEKVLRHCNPED
ncbi:hypothetical protein TSUD_231270 [Trifolium subterraneum]|nr:hypothetical protein TSUD_231270 [Trifolium subterraneum]